CLTGDAAWCASPRSGMGTTLALVGSHVLAHELHAAGDDYAAAFARYQRLLAPYVARCQKLAIDALKTERLSSGRLAPLRNVALRMLSIPAVSKLVARQSLPPARPSSLPTYGAAAPWRPAPAAKRPAPSVASAATREMLANS